METIGHFNWYANSSIAGELSSPIPPLGDSIPLPPCSTMAQWYIDDISLFRILHIGLASLAHPGTGGMGDEIPHPHPHKYLSYSNI